MKKQRIRSDPPRPIVEYKKPRTVPPVALDIDADLGHADSPTGRLTHRPFDRSLAMQEVFNQTYGKQQADDDEA